MAKEGERRRGVGYSCNSVRFSERKGIDGGRSSLSSVSLRSRLLLLGGVHFLEGKERLGSEGLVVDLGGRVDEVLKMSSEMKDRG